MNTEKINVFTAKLKKFASTDAFCFILPFAVLSVWLITLILRGKVEKASGYYILHYLYTFDRGFISRGLPGEIISWFTDTVTPELTVKISTALSFMLVFSSALCIGYALKRTANNPEIRKMIVFFVFVLAILPVSFRTFLVDPKFDKVLWSLSLVSVVLSENRKTLVLIPFLCVIATLINPVFLFTSMFFISLVLLQRFYDSGYSKLNLTICIVSYAAMIVVGIVSAYSQHGLEFESGAEMVDYFFARYSEPIENTERARLIRSCVIDFFEPYIECIKTSFRIYCVEWGEWKNTLANFIFLAIPLFCLFTGLWTTAIKEENNRFQKTIFVLYTLFPFVSIPLSLLSWEASRYFGNVLLVQLCLLIYSLVHENKSVVSAVKKIVALAEKHFIISACVAIYLAVFIADA